MKQTQISAKEYTSAGFIRRYQKLITDEMIPYQYRVLNDLEPGVEKSHAIKNFENAGKKLRGEDPGDGFYGFVFQDSDIAKWLEAAAYSLVNYPDPELEKKVDEVIALIGEAQCEDGYFDTYFILNGLEKRMTNLHEAHELYVSGHMTEAAVAYFEATGKDAFLNIMTRNMEFYYHYFVIEGHPGYPGHPEIELALVKLYKKTGNAHALELAKHFIDVRGEDPEFFFNERKNRSWTVWGLNPNGPDYNQAHAPIRKQTEARGHAVRAVYLFTGAAKIASLTKDKALLDACRGLWENIAYKQMYITGGIGSTRLGEAFTVDYDLPNDTVYAETCASIGLIFFSEAMLENELSGRYGDVMEQAFYNTVLDGMQLDGKSYFYVNPLEVVPGMSGKTIRHEHDLPVRPGWYACACCPPNVARLIESFGKYAYGENEDTAFCHMYAAGDITLENGIRFTCETAYPYELSVRYTMASAGKLAVRIPGWSKETKVLLNGEAYEPASEDGYAFFELQEGDQVELIFDDSVRKVYGNPFVPALSGRTAFMRGPLVYTFEGHDNEGHVIDLYAKKSGAAKVLPFNPEKLGGITELKIEGYRAVSDDTLYSDKAPEFVPCTMTAIPYYTWANRGESEMRVWLPEKE